MKLIVGLGNPGAQYDRTRHNVGFNVIDILARRWSIDLTKRKFQGRFGAGSAAMQSVLLLKPQTYMNRSGGSVADALHFYKVAIEDLLVVVDDLALDLGRLRMRPGGSAGGHNGLKDIIARLGSDEFARLRVGIGAARGANAVGHVLGAFSSQEQPVIEAAQLRAAEAVETWLTGGIDEAMNRYNKSLETDEQNNE